MDKAWIISKLTSRKLWMGVAGTVVGVSLCVVGYQTGDVTLENQGGTLVGASILGYVGAEALVDALRALATKAITTTSTATTVGASTTAKEVVQAALAQTPNTDTTTATEAKA